MFQVGDRVRVTSVPEPRTELGERVIGQLGTVVQTVEMPEFLAILAQMDTTEGVFVLMDDDGLRGPTDLPAHSRFPEVRGALSFSASELELVARIEQPVAEAA